MSKALIDLSRANAPRTKLADQEPQTELPATVPKTIAKTPQPKSANANRTKTATVESVAPKPSSTERQSTLGVRIPESLHQTIRIFCIANRIEIQQFVFEALTNRLAELQPGKD